MLLIEPFGRVSNRSGTCIIDVIFENDNEHEILFITWLFSRHGPSTWNASNIFSDKSWLGLH